MKTTHFPPIFIYVIKIIIQLPWGFPSGLFFKNGTIDASRPVFFPDKQTEIHSYPSVQHPLSPFIYLQSLSLHLRYFLNFWTDGNRHINLGFFIHWNGKSSIFRTKTKVWLLICNWSLTGQFITYISLGKNIPPPFFGFPLYKQIPWYKSTNITTALVIYTKT